MINIFEFVLQIIQFVISLHLTNLYIQSNLLYKYLYKLCHNNGSNDIHVMKYTSFKLKTLREKPIKHLPTLLV